MEVYWFCTRFTLLTFYLFVLCFTFFDFLRFYWASRVKSLITYFWLLFRKKSNWYHDLRSVKKRVSRSQTSGFTGFYRVELRLIDCELDVGCGGGRHWSRCGKIQLSHRSVHRSCLGRRNSGARVDVVLYKPNPCHTHRFRPSRPPSVSRVPLMMSQWISGDFALSLLLLLFVCVCVFFIFSVC